MKFTSSLLLLTDFSNAFVAEAEFTAIRDRRMQGLSFVNACLVSAKFDNTDVVNTNFTGAYLLGTSFVATKLSDVKLTHAKLASEPGTITAILAPRRGTQEPPEIVELTYEPTQLAPELTGRDTRCPDGAGGPCSLERLITVDVPATWTQPV